MYTGGDVCVSNKNEKYFICCSDTNANVIDYETGEILYEIQGVCKLYKIFIFEKRIHL